MVMSFQNQLTRLRYKDNIKENNARVKIDFLFFKNNFRIYMHLSILEIS